MIRIKGKGAVYGELWYDEELPGDSGVDIVTYRHRHAPVAGGRTMPFLTLVSDLSGDADAMAAGFDKDCRYEIRRAERKDGLRMELIAEPDGALDRFCAFYDAFAREKALIRCDHEWLVAACRAGQLVLSVAYRDDEALVWHAYVRIGTTTQLEYSASCFRNRGSDYRSLVGRANRWLHWQDMLRFREMGMARFDWGGLFEDESAPRCAGINSFKKGFGGRQERTYNCMVALTVRGRLWLILREAWSRCTPAPPPRPDFAPREAGTAAR